MVFYLSMMLDLIFSQNFKFDIGLSLLPKCRFIPNGFEITYFSSCKRASNLDLVFSQQDFLQKLVFFNQMSKYSISTSHNTEDHSFVWQKIKFIFQIYFFQFFQLSCFDHFKSDQDDFVELWNHSWTVPFGGHIQSIESTPFEFLNQLINPFQK